MQRRQWLGLASGSAALATLGAALAWRGSGTPEPNLVDEVCIVAPTFADDPASGQALTAARPVPASARCPVCGMFPARYPRWAAQVIFADGAAHFLDSPLNLLLYWQRVERYAPGRHAADIAAAWVSDFATTAWVDAAAAVYVEGSSELGPMRAGNLPAFAEHSQAQALVQRAGGRILDWGTLRRGLPAALQALTPHRHRL